MSIQLSDKSIVSDMGNDDDHWHIIKEYGDAFTLCGKRADIPGPFPVDGDFKCPPCPECIARMDSYG